MITDLRMDLTVAICVYNGEKYIIDTLRSLEEQSFKEFKILIIDDGSTDNTVNVVSEYLEKATFYDYEIIKCEINGGLAKARNIALDYVSTKFMMFFDADDIAKKNMVERMYLKISNDSKLIAVGTYAALIDENSNKIIGGIHVGCKSAEEALDKAKHGKLFFLPTCAMFSVADAKKVGGIAVEGFPAGKPRFADLCEDCDRWTRMSDLYIEGKYILVIPEELFLYRKHTNTVSNNNYNMLLRMKHIKKNVTNRRNRKKELSFVEFEKSLTGKEKKSIRREAKASILIRDMGFAIHNKHYLKAVVFGVYACICNPHYVSDKIKSNLRKK